MTSSGRAGYLWDLVGILVRKELKLRYRGTSLGVLWSLANPLAFAFVLHIAFQRVLQIEIENYAIFILSTLFPWQWFTNSMGEGPYSFISAAPLIKKLPFPRLAVPTAVVLGDLTHFLVTIPLLAAMVWWSIGSLPVTTWLVGAPILVVVQAVHTIALVALFACATAILRDVGQLVRVGLLLLFYVSPILFSADMYPDDLKWLLVANPVAPLMICWRDLVIHGQLSPYIGAACVHAAVAVVVASVVYHRLGWRVAEVV